MSTTLALLKPRATKQAASIAVAAVCLVVAPSFSSALVWAQALQQPPIALETRADLILIDASVLDGKGVPIGGLSIDDFRITIDGVPRPLSSAQFVKHDTTSATPVAAQPAHYSSNEPTANPGRNILIAVDENSMSPSGGRAVLASMERFLTRLSPYDQVGFARLPRFEHLVGFTTDRAKVRTAIGTVLGKATRIGVGRVTIAEAAGRERDDTFVWQRAITRLCGDKTGLDLETCRTEAEADAVQTYTELNARSRETIQALQQLAVRVREVPGPKTLLLVSQGFLAYQYRSEIVRVAQAAATSRVTIYVLHLDMPSFNVADELPSFTPMEDERLMADGVETLAGASRGARFRIAGSGDDVFSRVAQELSGYYLLAVEPTDADRDGKPHRIRVEVNRRGATVRARAEFTFEGGRLTTNPGKRGSTDARAEAADLAASIRDQLVDVLRSQAMLPGVPLRLTAFAAPGGTTGQVRVIVGADVGTPTTTPSDVHVGFVLIDGAGKVAGSHLGTMTLQPPDGVEPAPLQYVGSAEVAAGDYTLRLAVIDKEGREGSVHRPVVAKLVAAGPVTTSDLILAAPQRGRTAAVRPDVHLKLAGDTLQTLIELSSTDAEALRRTRVAFDVAESVTGAALVSERGRVAITPDAAKPATALLDVGVLPPGLYVARAVVTVPGQTPVTLTRPFEVAPRRRAANRSETGGSAAASAAASAASRGRMRPPIPPFKKEDVLAPETVRPFVDHVLERYSPSPAARHALEAIKTGDLANAARGERQVSDLAMSFAQGISLLATDRVAEADAYFRAALRQSSDFLGAAFYLGACLAAAGKDRDAVGAWQTALIGDVGAAGVYPVLIDGLLRLGDAEQAIAILEEAEPTFTDRNQYAKRLAQALALAGRYTDARPLAHEYLAAHSDDVDQLFLAMHLIYEGHAVGDLPDAAVELQRFRDYAVKYQALKGPQLPLVQGWRKALGIR